MSRNLTHLQINLEINILLYGGNNLVVKGVLAAVIVLTAMVLVPK